MVLYAVANGRTTGIFNTWNECSDSVKGYKNAKYKKFNTNEEAVDFIKTNNKNTDDIIIIKKVTPITSFFNIITPNEKEDVIEFVPDYYVYTDGACSNNGRDNAIAGIGVFFGVDDIRNISKKIDGKQTNNTAELSAIIETYFIIENDITSGKKVSIASDSEYAIRCVSTYGKKCADNLWRKDIPNKELVKKAYKLYKDTNVQFIHVKAHTNETDVHSIGNDNADKLANIAIGLESCPYNATGK